MNTFNYADIFKFLFGLLGGMLSFLYGDWAGALPFLIGIVCLDYFTGVIASWYEGKLSSKIGFKGIAKKVMLFAIVAAAHIIDVIVGSGNGLRDTVIFFYIANELLSIIENAGRTGLPIPSKLRDAINVFHNRDKDSK